MDKTYPHISLVKTFQSVNTRDNPTRFPQSRKLRGLPYRPKADFAWDTRRALLLSIPTSVEKQKENER